MKLAASLDSLRRRPDRPAGRRLPGRGLRPSRRSSGRTKANGSFVDGRRPRRRLGAHRPELPGPAVPPPAALGRRQGRLRRRPRPAGTQQGPDRRRASPKQITAAVAAARADRPGDARPVPADLVTTSALGPRSAPLARRGALAGGPHRAAPAASPEEQVAEVIRRHVEPRTLGFLGEPRVNVLLTNLDLDRALPGAPVESPMPQEEIAAHLPGRLPEAAREVAPREAQDLHRPRRRRRQDLPDARGRPPAQEAGRRRRRRLRRDARPRRDRRAHRGPRGHSPPQDRLQGQGRSRRWTCRPSSRRKPEVVIVDELAHTNVPGTENAKRYEDVEDLLDAGISVDDGRQHPALRVRAGHRVARDRRRRAGARAGPDPAAGRRRRERGPALRGAAGAAARRQDLSGRADQPALENFFTEENLASLRELAMRQIADRLEAERRGARGSRGHRAGRHEGHGRDVVEPGDDAPAAAPRLRARRQAQHELVRGLRPHAARQPAADVGPRAPPPRTRT